MAESHNHQGQEDTEVVIEWPDGTTQTLTDQEVIDDFGENYRTLFDTFWANVHSFGQQHLLNYTKHDPLVFVGASGEKVRTLHQLGFVYAGSNSLCLKGANQLYYVTASKLQLTGLPSNWNMDRDCLLVEPAAAYAIFTNRTLPLGSFGFPIGKTPDGFRSLCIPYDWRDFLLALVSHQEILKAFNDSFSA